MKFYASISTSALLEEGEESQEKVEFIVVLEINCIVFIPSNEKWHCSFTYGD